jgi:hypothetical protein
MIAKKPLRYSFAITAQLQHGRYEIASL